MALRIFPRGRLYRPAVNLPVNRRPPASTKTSQPSP